LIDAGYMYYTNPENIKYSNQKYFTIQDKKVSVGVSEQNVVLIPEIRQKRRIFYPSLFFFLGIVY